MIQLSHHLATCPRTYGSAVREEKNSPKYPPTTVGERLDEKRRSVRTLTKADIIDAIDERIDARQSHRRANVTFDSPVSGSD